MHNTLRKALNNAVGKSQYVIAVFLDIRDFSRFSKSCESPNVAMFIKKVYIKLIDEYFSYASFFKPTGDGLLLIFSYTEKNLKEVSQKVLNSCITVLSSFASFCTNDPMINFEVPTELGIGIARDTACCIISGKKTLDYSGRVLNLASRLMDFARPSGIVLDGNFDISLLSEEQAKLFAKDTIYIKGIAEKKPVDVFYTKNFTTIPSIAKRPILETKWREIKDTKKFAEIKKITGHYRYALPTKPLNLGEITVRLQFPLVSRGRRMKGLLSFVSFKNFTVKEEAGQTLVRVDFDALTKMLEESSIRKSWNVDIMVSYPEP